MRNHVGVESSESMVLLPSDILHGPQAKPGEAILLLVSCSLHGSESKSRTLAMELIREWLAQRPDTVVCERDLDANAIPHLTREDVLAWRTAAERRTAAQHEVVRSADLLIEELESASVLVFAAPMYNFSIPSTLKAWIDRVTRAGRTFRYTDQGPQGLLADKQVFIVSSRGGMHVAAHDGGLDCHETYLRTMLGFLGLRNLAFIKIDNQSKRELLAGKGMEAARAQIARLVARDSTTKTEVSS